MDSLQQTAERNTSSEGKTKSATAAGQIWTKEEKDSGTNEAASVSQETKGHHALSDLSSIYSRDLLPAESGELATKSFLHELVDVLFAYICKSFRRSSKVLDFHHAHQLKDGVEGFTLELPDQPESLEQLLVDCRDTLRYGVKTGHPRCFNQSGLDIIGLAGEWLTSTANTNIFTYEVSPVFILMEEVLLRKMMSLIGWPEEEGDGIFCPGGSMSNLNSVLLARYNSFPEVKKNGMAALPKLAMLTSSHSHYSILKAAAVLGIGTGNVLLVKCDERGKMMPAELESSIITAKDKGLVPFYVNATAGTTVYGAFDPLNDIADICERHGLWMHVDAAWGGGLLLSKRHCAKLNGIDRASSVTWNPHKTMGVPIQCSAILVRRKGLLQECNQLRAAYLFQPDNHYDDSHDNHYDVSHDTGDKTLQYGRHVDVFKLWLMWKAKGSEGFESQINRCLDNAEYLYDELEGRADFQLVFKSKPEHSHVCFWYLPHSVRNLPAGPERNNKLHVVAPKISGKMMEAGQTMIGYQPLGDNVNFFRCVVSNPATQREDVDFLLDEIARRGSDL